MTTTNKKPAPESALSERNGSALRALINGDVIQRGDVFIDDGKQYEMSKTGVILGVRCLGQTITKPNGFFRPMPNSRDET